MKISIFLLIAFFIGSDYSFASGVSEEIEAKKELLSRMPHQSLLGKEFTPTEEEVSTHFTRYVYSKFALNQAREALEIVELLAKSGDPAWQVQYSKHLLEGIYISSDEAEAEKYYLKAKPHEDALSGDAKDLFLELEAFFSSKREDEKLTHSVKSLSLKSSTAY